MPLGFSSGTRRLWKGVGLAREDREVVLDIPVVMDDGLTREECGLRAERVFTGVMGDTVHRLDELSLGGSRMEASYTWAVNENDLGHFFSMTGDLRYAHLSSHTAAERCQGCTRLRRKW